MESDSTIDNPSLPPSEAANIFGVSVGGDFTVQGSVNVHVSYVSRVEHAQLDALYVLVLHSGRNVSQIINPKPKRKCMFQVQDPVNTFHGREKFLEDLHDSIQKLKTQGLTISVLSQTSTIIGLGGIGKTETARMYIKRFGDEYDNIAWIDAEYPLETKKQFNSLAENKLQIRLSDKKGSPREFSHILEKVYEKLCNKSSKLLIIFDNFEVPESNGSLSDGIRQFLPAQMTMIEPPVVLITSRQQRWRDMNVIQLGLWDIAECVQYICKRLKLADTEENQQDANKLARLFRQLPIAVRFAVSGILEQSKENQNYSIQQFFSEYSKITNVAGQNEQSISVQVAIYKLLNLTLEKIKKHKNGQLALEILASMAYLSPTKTPQVILSWLFPQTEKYLLDDALELLRRYSIIQGFTEYFTIHRVFQDAVIAILNNADDSELQPERNNFIFCCFYRNSQARTPPQLPASCTFTSNDEISILTKLTCTFIARITTLDQFHDNDALTCIIHTTMNIIKNSTIAHFYPYVKTMAKVCETICCETAIEFYLALLNFDIKINNFKPKKTFNKVRTMTALLYRNHKYQQSLEILNILLHGGIISSPNNVSCIAIHEGQKQVMGDFHSDTLETKQDIALCLRGQEKIDKALEVFYAILKTREEVLGISHPESLTTKIYIADCLEEQDKLPEALVIYEAALEAQQKVLGVNHPDTWETKNSIADCLFEQNKTGQASKLYNEILEGMKEELGELDPDTLDIQTKIADCLAEEGKQEEAITLYNFVLEAQEKILGSFHADTVSTKQNIADYLAKQGLAQDAVVLYSAILQVQKQQLGILHEDTLVTQTSIADCFLELGKTVEALKVYTALFAAQEQIFDYPHPDTLCTQNKIASCLAAEGKEKDALDQLQLILEAEETLYGPIDYHVINTKNKIADSLFKLGKIDDALKLYDAVQEVQKKEFGPLNPATISTQEKLARCMVAQGKEKDALDLLYVVLETQAKVFGSLNEYTLGTKFCIANCLFKLNKYEEASKVYETLLEDQKKVFSALHPNILCTKNKIASCLAAQGKENDALDLFYAVLEVHEKTFGARHKFTLITQDNIAKLLVKIGKKEEGLKFYNAVLEAQMELFGPYDVLTLSTQEKIAVCLAELGKLEDALDLFVVILEAQKTVFGALHQYTLATQEKMANCLYKLDKKEESLKLYKALFIAQKKLFGARHPFTICTRNKIEFWFAEHVKENDSVCLNVL